MNGFFVVWWSSFLLTKQGQEQTSHNPVQAQYAIYVMCVLRVQYLLYYLCKYFTYVQHFQFSSSWTAGYLRHVYYSILPVIYGLLHTFRTGSVYSTIAVTMERFFAIVFPFRWDDSQNFSPIKPFYRVLLGDQAGLGPGLGWLNFESSFVLWAAFFSYLLPRKDGEHPKCKSTQLSSDTCLFSSLYRAKNFQSLLVKNKSKRKD